MDQFSSSSSVWIRINYSLGRLSWLWVIEGHFLYKNRYGWLLIFKNDLYVKFLYSFHFKNPYLFSELLISTPVSGPDGIVTLSELPPRIYDPTDSDVVVTYWLGKKCNSVLNMVCRNFVEVLTHHESFIRPSIQQKFPITLCSGTFYRKIRQLMSYDSFLIDNSHGFDSRDYLSILFTERCDLLKFPVFSELFWGTIGSCNVSK